MAGRIQALAPFLPREKPAGCCTKLKQLVELTLQIAIRILFVAVSVLAAAAAFPVGFHAVVLPVVGFSAALLTAFFFQSAKSSACPTAPRGIRNSHNNCAFNAVTQMLDSIPPIASWLRQPLSKKDLEDPVRVAFFHFFAAYDRAVQEGNPVVGADSEMLRVALGFKKGQQVDAEEVLARILETLPSHLKFRVSERCERLESEYQPASPGTAEILSPHCIIPLHCTKQNNVIPQLGQMVQEYLQNDTFLDEAHQLPVRTHRQFVEPPPFLIFHINRGIDEVSSEVGVVPVKTMIPIGVPDEITIPLANGEQRNYRLVSTATHLGATGEAGHYIATRMVDGQEHLINDERVTLADQAIGKRADHSQAYLLAYLPA